ncbi:hypothetical protein [Convivina intestini]|uniref:Uncharacterized protein n=1 Tax=Convivina intestini TaxID=1505726 RepID=A0A2U1D5H8_9LACO|nr:hypothetical protein [Convivina intestini]PVY82849.1 hypothetical protein C7384_11043 [Convivina intestini]CAH1856894.1 hypothetical protein R077811_01365 [Convivina intestini]SDC11380.1 hypothetical protein SAMN05216341_1139 [Leuconostocaceae bacterium R-53105]
MLKNNKDRWGRDEFQVAETGKIDTRGLYIAMGLLLILMVLALFKIHWAATETQLFFILAVLTIHQAVEQTLRSTDTLLLKIPKQYQLIIAIAFLLSGISYLHHFLSQPSFLHHQITFVAMLNLMVGIFMTIYAGCIGWMLYRGKKN